MTNGLDFPARRDQRSVSAQIPAGVQGVGVQRVGAMLTVRVSFGGVVQRKNTTDARERNMQQQPGPAKVLIFHRLVLKASFPAHGLAQR